MLRVLSWFRRRPVVVQTHQLPAPIDLARLGDRIAFGFAELVQQVADVAEELKAGAPGSERLDALEASRLMWEAECEALLMKAGGKLQAAANAEARSRTMKKAYETELDPLSEDSEEAGEADTDIIAARNAEIVRAAGMQPMHVGVADSNRATALRAKWS